jgi:hypothetical protein
LCGLVGQIGAIGLIGLIGEQHVQISAQDAHATLADSNGSQFATIDDVAHRLAVQGQSLDDFTPVR